MTTQSHLPLFDWAPLNRSLLNETSSERALSGRQQLALKGGLRQGTSPCLTKILSCLPLSLSPSTPNLERPLVHPVRSEYVPPPLSTPPPLIPRSPTDLLPHPPCLEAPTNHENPSLYEGLDKGHKTYLLASSLPPLTSLGYPFALRKSSGLSERRPGLHAGFLNYETGKPASLFIRIVKGFCPKPFALLFL